MRIKFVLALSVLFVSQLSFANYLQVDCQAECFDVDQGSGHMYFNSEVSSQIFTKSTKTAKQSGWTRLKAQCPVPSMLMQRVFVKFTQKAEDGASNSNSTSDDDTTVTHGWWQHETDVYNQHSESENHASNENRQKFRLIRASAASACTVGAPTPVTEIGGSPVGG
jgi:hypothetical protein